MAPARAATALLVAAVCAAMLGAGVVRAEAEMGSVNGTMAITVQQDRDVVVNYIDGAGAVVQQISVKGLQADVMQLQTDLAQLIASVQSVNASVAAQLTALAGRTATLEGGSTMLQGRVATVENTATSLGGRVTTLEGTVAANDLTLKAVQPNVTANSNALQSVASQSAVATLGMQVGQLRNQTADLEKKTSEDTLGLEECNPAPSCLCLLRPGRPSGVYWLESKTTNAAYQAYCDMNVEGGGWEVVWKNVGGAQPTSVVSNLNMRASGANRIAPVMPPTTDLNTHTAAMAIHYEERAAAVNYEWLKVGVLYDATNKVMHNQTVRVDLGDSVTMKEIFTLGTARCDKLSGFVDVYVNDRWQGSTQWALKETASYGLANTGHGTSDDCGQAADALINVGPAFVRADTVTAGDNTIRHLFSYVDNNGARDASRCMYCCWGCAGMHETFMWLVRPRIGLGTRFNPASDCAAIRASKSNLKSGLYYLNGASGTAYEAFCDMDVNGGGFEIVHKQIGGHALPNSGTGLSNQQLRDGSGRSTPMLPPLQDLPVTHVAGMSNSWDMRSKQRGLQWSKVTKAYKGGKVVAKKEYLIDFGAMATMSDVFSAPPVTYCHAVSNPIKVYLDGTYRGQTKFVNSYQAGGQTYGLASSTAPVTDQCSQPKSQEFLVDTGVRHLFSYVDNSNGQDASRCEFCCWGSTCNNQYDYELVVWGVRPQPPAP